MIINAIMCIGCISDPSQSQKEFIQHKCSLLVLGKLKNLYLSPISGNRQRRIRTSQAKIDSATLWNDYRLKDNDFTECIQGVAAAAAAIQLEKMNQERFNGQNSRWHMAE